MTRCAHVGVLVHLVVGEGDGARCRAALITAVSPVTDAYRPLDTVGLRAWPDDGDPITRPLPDGGARYDAGLVSKILLSTCTGRAYQDRTWHHIQMEDE